MLHTEKKCFLQGNSGIALARNCSEGLVLGLAGLGSVGGTAAAGLRMMPVAQSGISKLIIYDRDTSVTQRWRLELEAIRTPWRQEHPEVILAKEPEELFNSDIFAFCVSLGVPEPGDDTDVRKRQLKGNAAILRQYAEMARVRAYPGLFAVISDPVEHLCAVAQEILAFPKGRIIGLGLGVMFARAVAIAAELSAAEGLGRNLESFLEKGLIFGSHGEDVLFLTGPGPESGFDKALSERVSALTATRNLLVRKTGFKPFVGPAFSSAALSLAAIAKGHPFFGSILSGDIFFGGPMRSLLSSNPLEPRILIQAQEVELCREAASLVAGSRGRLREEFCRMGTLVVQNSDGCSRS